MGAGLCQYVLKKASQRHVWNGATRVFKSAPEGGNQLEGLDDFFPLSFDFFIFFFISPMCPTDGCGDNCVCLYLSVALGCHVRSPPGGWIMANMSFLTPKMHK